MGVGFQGAVSRCCCFVLYAAVANQGVCPPSATANPVAGRVAASSVAQDEHRWAAARLRCGAQPADVLRHHPRRGGTRGLEPPPAAGGAAAGSAVRTRCEAHAVVTENGRHVAGRAGVARYMQYSLPQSLPAGDAPSPAPAAATTAGQTQLPHPPPNRGSCSLQLLCTPAPQAALMKADQPAVEHLLSSPGMCWGLPRTLREALHSWLLDRRRFDPRQQLQRVRQLPLRPQLRPPPAQAHGVLARQRRCCAHCWPCCWWWCCSACRRGSQPRCSRLLGPLPLRRRRAAAAASSRWGLAAAAGGAHALRLGS